ncbi:hypothetical protein BJF84_27235 [Rhodococcus sp. CUA-806]|nr:hypothetical protein BJF84_27235 [Rhodococcus sp. CUA-806]
MVLIDGRDSSVDLPETGAHVVDVEALDLASYSSAALSDSDRVGLLRPDNAAYVIFTSGSTGRPKGVSVSHRAVVNQLEWKRSEYGLDSSDVSLLKTAATFDLSVWELWSWATTGGRLVIAAAEGHRDPAYLVEVIERESVTTLHVVPSVLGALVSASGGSLPGSVRRVLAIGEALPASTAESVLQGSDVRLDNVYGPTEAAVSVTSTGSSCRWDRRFRSVARSGIAVCMCSMRVFVRCPRVWWVSCIWRVCSWRGGITAGWI